MMKKIISLILILLLVSVPVLASSAPSIVDDAQLLSASEAATLAGVADQITANYHIDVVIVTVNSLGNKTASGFADDYYDYNGYSEDGILLLLSMEDRDWAISTAGRAIRIFSDRDIDNIFARISNDLGNDDYYSAFSRYLKEIQDHLYAYENGEPVTTKDILVKILIALLIGAAAGGITIGVMRSKMNTSRRQTDATVYMVEESYNLYRSGDLYLYSTTSKTRKQTNNGSSTHRGSSGSSHGGRSGKF